MGEETDKGMGMGGGVIGRAPERGQGGEEDKGREIEREEGEKGGSEQGNRDREER